MIKIPLSVYGKFKNVFFFHARVKNHFIKEIESVISSDLPFVEYHVRFTTIPFIPLFDQGIRILIYIAGN